MYLNNWEITIFVKKEIDSMAKDKKCEVVAVDLGNILVKAVGSTKTFICESRIRKVQSNLDEFSQNEKFTFDGEDYLINSGSFENDILKFKKDNYLALLYYSIVKVISEDQNNINLVVAIPISQYKSKKDEMEAFIKKNNKKTIILNGKKRTIVIENLVITPESYSLKVIREITDKLERGCDTIIIDSGSGTTDISIYNNKLSLIDGKSIQLGLLNLYQMCREYINITYDLNISLEEARLIFNGEKKILGHEFENKNNIVKKFLIALINEIKTVDNLKNSNIVLVGGTAEILGSTIKKIYPQTLIYTDVTLQSQGLYRIGEKIFNQV